MNQQDQIELTVDNIDQFIGHDVEVVDLHPGDAFYEKKHFFIGQTGKLCDEFRINFHKKISYRESGYFELHYSYFISGLKVKLIKK